jgi:hypothetical protein
MREPVGRIQISVILRDDILGYDVRREARETQGERHGIPGILEIQDPFAQFLHQGLDHRFELQDSLPGEERVDHTSAHAVDVVVLGSEAGKRKVKLLGEKVVFVARRVLRVEDFVKVWIIDMKLVGTDPDDGTLTKMTISVSHLSKNRGARRRTVLLVQLCDLESVLALQDIVIVKLIPQRRRSELGTGKFGQRGETEAVDNTNDDIHGHKSCCAERIASRSDLDRETHCDGSWEPEPNCWVRVRGTGTAQVAGSSANPRDHMSSLGFAA